MPVCIEGRDSNNGQAAGESRGARDRWDDGTKNLSLNGCRLEEPQQMMGEPGTKF